MVPGPFPPVHGSPRACSRPAVARRPRRRRRVQLRQLPGLVRDGLLRPLPHAAALLDLLPASPPCVSAEEWLHVAWVDASCALVGVEWLRVFVGLRTLSDAELLRHVWQPDFPTFPAIDLQFQRKERVGIERDVMQSAAVAAADWKAAAGQSTWARRVSDVVLSRWQLSSAPELGLSTGNTIPVIAVGGSGGPGDCWTRAPRAGALAHPPLRLARRWST